MCDGGVEVGEGTLWESIQMKKHTKICKKHTKACTSCLGYGFWAVGEPSPMGRMDYMDGYPNKKCKECGHGRKATK